MLLIFYIGNFRKPFNHKKKFKQWRETSKQIATIVSGSLIASFLSFCAGSGQWIHWMKQTQALLLTFSNSNVRKMVTRIFCSLLGVFHLPWLLFIWEPKATLQIRWQRWVWTSKSLKELISLSNVLHARNLLWWNRGRPYHVQSFEGSPLQLFQVLLFAKHKSTSTRLEKNHVETTTLSLGYASYRQNYLLKLPSCTCSKFVVSSGTVRTVTMHGY